MRTAASSPPRAAERPQARLAPLASWPTKMRQMPNETVSSTGVGAPPPAAKPPAMSSSPIDRVVGDLAVEWKGRGRYPPGPGGHPVTRTLKIARDPLPILPGGYEEY